VIVLYVPGRFLVKDATEEEKEVVDQLREIMNEVIEGKRKGIILPSEFDENGNRLFNIEVFDYNPGKYIIKESPGGI
jgi:hypothetical protein